MTESDFTASLLETEVIIAHIPEGHVYHFPILTNDTVSLHGSTVEPNPSSKRGARRFWWRRTGPRGPAIGGISRPLK